ncbi:MAG: MotA/TolQ/ExbB proton channel family protein [Planctomycetota bacterium]
MANQILDAAGLAIYLAMAAAAVYGLFVIALCFRRLGQKSFRSDAAADAFVAEVTDAIGRGEFDAVTDRCDRPDVWAKAVPQLTAHAVADRDLSIARLRRASADRFDRDVLADLDVRMSWIGTIAKSAPMLGLLGTVVGMINAFGKIAAMQASGRTDPSVLAQDISFALSTTAIGLAIAIPMVVSSTLLRNKIGRLTDDVRAGTEAVLAALADRGAPA